MPARRLPLWSTTALALSLPWHSPLDLPLPYPLGYRVRQPWSTTTLTLGFPCPCPWPAIVLSLGLPEKGSCVQGQGPRSPSRAQGLKFTRVPGAEGSRSPETQGSKGSSYQGFIKESKGPRVQGSRGLMMQGLEAQGVVHCLRNSQRLGGSRIQGTGSKGSRVKRLKRPRV